MVLIVVVFVVCVRRETGRDRSLAWACKKDHTATMASDEEDGIAMSLDESSINLTPSTAATPSNQQQCAATHYNHPLAAVRRRPIETTRTCRPRRTIRNCHHPPQRFSHQIRRRTHRGRTSKANQLHQRQHISGFATGSWHRVRHGG